MKCNIPYALVAILSTMLTTSCVTDVEYNNGENIVDLALCALAQPDSTFYVQLSYVRGINSGTGGSYFSGIGDVSLRVNSTEMGAMTLDQSTTSFRSDYVPTPGDEIEVNVSASVYNTNITASTTVPLPVDFNVISMSMDFVETDNTYLSDSVLVLRLKFTDPKENNFYRLTVRNVRCGYQSEAYTSETDIISEALSSTPTSVANVSPIFSDETFNGNEFEIIVNTWIPKWYKYETSEPLYDDDGNLVNQYVVIILENITEDYYNYIGSVFEYSNSDTNSSMSQSVAIYSNCSNNIGILAASAPTYHIISY